MWRDSLIRNRIFQIKSFGVLGRGNGGWCLNFGLFSGEMEVIVAPATMRAVQCFHWEFCAKLGRRSSSGAPVPLGLLTLCLCLSSVTQISQPVGWRAPSARHISPTEWIQILGPSVIGRFIRERFQGKIYKISFAWQFFLKLHIALICKHRNLVHIE